MATGLQIKVGADTTEFKQEIRQLPREFEKAEEEISQSAERVGGALDGAFKGLISAGTVVAIERIINHFDKVADAASKYGESAEDIQRVGTAAEMTGGNIDFVAMAMERAGVAAAKAARGNEEFVEKFNRAGIDAAAFSTATLTERISMVAKAQNEASNNGDRHASILEAVGDSAAGIDFQRIADEMGNVIVASNETVGQLSRANDTMHKAKGAAMVFGAEGLGVVADYFERIGSILGEGDSGILGKLAAFNKIALQLIPFAPVANMLGLGGQTIQQMEEAEKRLNAIALLKSREGINNATEQQIEAEMAAIVEREKQASRAATTTNEAIDQGKSKTEENAKIKQRLLEISLELKEAEIENNSELVTHLRYQEDLYKGVLKYKDAEDGYGMAVRAANAELEKRNQLISGANKTATEFEDVRAKYIAGLSQSMNLMPAAQREARKANSRKYREMIRINPELLNLGGAASQMAASAGVTESERQESARQTADPATSKFDAASETTLQKVAALLETLNTKLPQPVLV